MRCARAVMARAFFQPMRQILIVQPLTQATADQVAKIEISMAAARAEAAKFEKLYRATIDALCKAFDPNYKLNSTDPSSLYSAEVKNGCIVIMKD